MPQLYLLDRKLPHRLNFYFPSARYDNYSRKWKYDLNKDFPDQAYIHLDELDYIADNDFWIELRKITERQFEGDCFVETKRNDYRWWWNKDATSEYSKETHRVTHGYFIFYFESSSDLVLFKLKFREMTSEKAYRFHPGYGISCMDRRYDVSEDEKVEIYY